MQETTTPQQFNKPKEDFDQLKDFYEVSHLDLQESDHFRYTHLKYKQLGRGCHYAVVFEKDENDEIIATNYKPEAGHKPFSMYSTNKYKKYRFYKTDNKVKFNELDLDTTPTEEIKDIFETHQQEVTLKTIEELEINKDFYVSNNKFQKTDREVKKLYLVSVSKTQLEVKNNQEAPRTRKMKGECEFKKYLFYQ
jgi:hypothetical protein